MIELEVKDWIEKYYNDSEAVMLDVRTLPEYSEGIICNEAIKVDFLDEEKFLNFIKKIDINKSYYVYCKRGIRSKKACIIMNSFGITKTFNLLGGIDCWNKYKEENGR